MRSRLKRVTGLTGRAVTQDAPPYPDQEPSGLQGPFGPSPDPDWDFYWPTNTRQPQRKYTQMARYSRRYQVLEVIFRDGTPWHWDLSSVGPEEANTAWEFFRRSRSTYDMLFIPEGAIQDLYGKGEPGGWGSDAGPHYPRARGASRQ